MGSRWDVVVIGAGAAGVAAVRAAHGKGRTVALVDGGPGASAMTAGWVEPPRTNENEAAWPRFKWLGEMGLRAAGTYRFASLSGLCVEAVSGLASLLDLNALGKGALAVLDVAADTAWSPVMMARSLERELGRSVSVVRPRDGFVGAQGTLALARWLDAKEGRAAFVEGLKEACKGLAALLTPPILGAQTDDAAGELSTALGCAVGEAGGGPSDPTALRLSRALDRAVPRDVERVRGRATLAWDHDDAIVTVSNGAVLRAGAVVMATGGLAGGGLTYDDRMREVCVGAPVWIEREGVFEFAGSTNADPQKLFAPDDDGRVEALRVGVRVDAAGRILGPDGRTPLRDNLFAVGQLVAAGEDVHARSLADALADGRTVGEHAAGVRARG